MDNKKKLQHSYDAAKGKFSSYIEAVYELLDNKNERTISKREAAKKEWQHAIKAYNELVSSTMKRDDNHIE